MAVRLAALLPRFVVLTLLWVLATATLTFAAEKRLSSPSKVPSTAVTGRPVIVVPEVSGQAYVFAKGMLADAGFAWRITGSVHGYAANVVAQQTPAAGTRVFDTGAPTIALRLARGRYPERGTPEDASSFAGTRLRLADRPVRAPVAPAKPRLARKPVKQLNANPKPKLHAKPRLVRHPNVANRRPAAFAVAGAPREPLTEISLPARGVQLRTWLATHRRPTDANVRHWLYQHAWLVQGADFGWWHGAQALTILIGVDRRVESVWGIGYRSEGVARAALKRVRARAR